MGSCPNAERLYERIVSIPLYYSLTDEQQEKVIERMQANVRRLSSMTWLAILVALSPTLAFKGLTLTTLWAWFNVHPFWFAFTVGLLLKSTHICIKGKD